MGDNRPVVTKKTKFRKTDYWLEELLFFIVSYSFNGPNLVAGVPERYSGIIFPESTFLRLRFFSINGNSQISSIALGCAVRI